MSFTTLPTMGVKFGEAISSTDLKYGSHKLGTQVFGDDGFRYIFARAGGTLGSTASITLGTGFTAAAAASAGVGTHRTLIPGGLTAGQLFWARFKTVAM